jgi:thioesterase domain-containing protein/acyl carrier protein
VVPKPGETIDPATLRSFLKDKLPVYMVPTSCVVLGALPLTPSGKVDRRSLPAPQLAGADAEDHVPPRTAMEKKLAEILGEVLGIREIGVRDDFFELGGQSLDAVRVFARVKEDLGRDLPLNAVFRAPTIEQLAELLDSDQSCRAWQPVVPIQPFGTKPPLFWIHTLGGGGGGGLFRYKKLADLLDPDQPSLGIQAPPEPFRSIEEMARNYVQAIRTVQPKGPYHLIGYCFGGNVAFEMAQQIRGAGEEVAFLAVMDSGAFPPTNRPPYPLTAETLRHFSVNFFFWFLDLLGRKPTDNWVRLKRTLGRVRKMRETAIRHQRGYAPNLEEVINLDEYPADFRGHAEAHWRAFLEYKPRPYPGHIWVFRVRRQGLLDFEPTLGWRVLAPEYTHSKIVPGLHDTIFDEPHVQQLAKILKASLHEARAGSPQP